MSNIIQELESEQLKTDMPEFMAGDTVNVQVRVREGERERLQAFEGVVIAKKNRGLNSSFTVEVPERAWALISPVPETVLLSVLRVKTLANALPLAFVNDIIISAFAPMDPAMMIMVIINCFFICSPFRFSFFFSSAEDPPRSKQNPIPFKK